MTDTVESKVAEICARENVLPDKLLEAEELANVQALAEVFQRIGEQALTATTWADLARLYILMDELEASFP